MQVHFNSLPKKLKGIEPMVKDELRKLERYSDKIEKADVFCLEPEEAGNAHRIEIKLAVPGPDAFATHEAETFNKAFVQCVTKLKNQLKSRRAYHHGRK